MDASGAAPPSEHAPRPEHYIAAGACAASSGDLAARGGHAGSSGRVLPVLAWDKSGCMAAIASTPAAPGNMARLRILTLNDFHGQLGDSQATVGKVGVGGAATLSAYIRRERAAVPEGSVLVGAGDLLGASPPEAQLLRQHSTMAVLDAMGMEITTLGNHEFDEGYAEAIRIIYGDSALAQAQAAQGIAPKQAGAGGRRKRRGAGAAAAGAASGAGAAAAASAAAQAGSGAAQIGAKGRRPAWPGSPFPWVNANIVHTKTGTPVLPPFVVRTINGVKVAFIGATTKDLKNVTVAEGIPNITATDPVAAINRYVPMMRAQGARTIVVLLHEGGTAGESGSGTLSGPIVDIAKRLDPEVDAIVSGHSHAEYATEVAGKQVVQAGSYGRALGVIDLQVDRATGNVVAGASKLVRNDEKGIAPDPYVDRLVKGFVKAVAPRTERVVGKLTAPLTRAPSPAGENLLGSFVADAQRAFAKTDIAVMNNGGLRQDIRKAGPVTWGDAFRVHPFGNEVMRLEMTGAQLLAVLEQQFPTGGDANVLQVSGMTVHHDLTKPAGSRVVKVVLHDGSALDPAKTYTVAANSFIADGGDGFDAFKAVRKRRKVGSDLQALVQHLQSGASAPTAPQGRLVLVGGRLEHHDH